MNRKDRRAYERRTGKPYKPLNDGVTFDKTVQAFCWLHKTLRWENRKDPTENDKKQLESIRLKPWKTTDRNGKVTMGRTCPRCGNTVYVSEERSLAHASLEGYTDKTQVKGLESV